MTEQDNRMNPAVNAPLSVAGISSYLTTTILGSTLAVMRSCGSTNAYIKTRSPILDDGFAAVSETQLSGRGRLGKTFISPEGGLYMSVLLMDKRFIENIDFITVRAALAVSAALRELTGLDNIGIKWVNDIYCGDKKICGILAERVVRKGICDFTVLGIGINVTTPKDYFRSEGIDCAASLSEFTKIGFSKNKLCAYILNYLEKYLLMTGKDASNGILDEYRSLSVIIGKDIYILSGNVSVKATALGIDNDASLYVRYEDGTTAIIRTGEVSTRLASNAENKQDPLGIETADDTYAPDKTASDDASEEAHEKQTAEKEDEK